MEDITPRYPLIPASESVVSENDGLIEKVGGVGGLGGRSANTIADAINQAGNLVNDVINVRIDTSAKTILDAFTFGASGAIQIGTYVNGVSGDIRISPNGIVARDSAGANTIAVDGTTGSVTMVGTITATAGSIGGWTIGATYIYYDGATDALSAGMASLDYPFYAGKKYVDRATAPFKVTPAGALTATSATITGALTAGPSSSLSTTYLVGTLTSSQVNVAARGWTFPSTFSASDADTVAWTAASFTASDGTAYSIDAGNTGNMAALTYIYLDIAVSTTVLQTTTTATTAVGDGKVLIAVAQNQTSRATFQVFGGSGGQNLLVDNLVANSASTNEFISNSAQMANLVVTNAKINDLSVAKLTAGTITSKAITLAVNGGDGDSKIQAGKTDFTNTETGFILGLDDSDSDKPKFYIGNTTDYLNWDGADLNYTGLSRMTIKLTMPFEDLTRYPVFGSGYAGIDNGLYIRAHATATANNYKLFDFTVGPSANSNIMNDSSFSTLVFMRNRDTDTTGNNGNFYIGVSGSPAVGDGTTMTMTNAQYGFKVLKVDRVMNLYATCADGSTETATDLGTIAQGDIMYLSAVYRGSKVRYFKDGSLVATHTTNLPPTNTSINMYGIVFVNNANTAYYYDWVIGAYSYEKLTGYF